MLNRFLMCKFLYTKFINNHSRRKIVFSNDVAIEENKVGVTCENCVVENCDVIVVKPKRLLREKRKKR